MKTNNWIAYNAGCDIWEVVKFNSSIEWHNNELVFETRSEANECARDAMKQTEEHYPNAEYGSIWDY